MFQVSDFHDRCGRTQGRTFAALISNLLIKMCENEHARFRGELLGLTVTNGMVIPPVGEGVTHCNIPVAVVRFLRLKVF
jgi:hypothetical protein